MLWCQILINDAKKTISKISCFTMQKLVGFLIKLYLHIAHLEKEWTAWPTIIRPHVTLSLDAMRWKLLLEWLIVFEECIISIDIYVFSNIGSYQFHSPLWFWFLNDHMFSCTSSRWILVLYFICFLSFNNKYLLELEGWRHQVINYQESSLSSPLAYY